MRSLINCHNKLLNYNNHYNYYNNKCNYLYNLVQKKVIGGPRQISMWFIIVRMKLPTFHPNLRRYDGQFSLMSTTKTTTLKGAPFKRRTK